MISAFISSETLVLFRVVGGEGGTGDEGRVGGDANSATDILPWIDVLSCSSH